MPLAQPPFTLSMPYETIKNLNDSSGIIEDEITRVPCHTQATERLIEDVTKVSQAFASKRRRGDAICATLDSHKKRSQFESKKDYN